MGYDTAGLNVRSRLRQTTVEVIVVGLVVQRSFIEWDQGVDPPQGLECPLGSGQILLAKVVDPSVQSVSYAHMTPHTVHSTRLSHFHQSFHLFRFPMPCLRVKNAFRSIVAAEGHFEDTF